MGGTWGRSVVRRSVDSCLRQRESSTPGHIAQRSAHVLTTYLPNLPTYLPIYLTYLPTHPPARPPIHRRPTDSSLPPPLVYRYISGNDSRRRRRRCAFASSLTQPSSSSHARPSRHSLYIDVYTRTEIPITAEQERQSFLHTVRGTQRIIFDVNNMCKFRDLYFDSIYK